MDYLQAVQAAFIDELEKIAVHRALTTTPKHRSGRRPMRVDTLLRKEKDGTFYRKLAEKLATSGGVLIPYAADDPQNVRERAAKKPRTAQDVPSREDGREATSTVFGPGRFVLAPGATNYPEEHGNF